MAFLNENKAKIIEALKELWNYMNLNQTLEKGDLIIGCGCSNLEVPVKCAQLFKEGYGKKILFTGGLGKDTEGHFTKPEAEIYKEIAIKNGVNENDIIIETKSTNTGDNFRFSKEILEQQNINYNKIIIVHRPLSERRTISTAKAILENKELSITSPDMSFEEFLKYLKESKNSAIDVISVIVGDIQRMIIYPQFGWQIENEVPENVIKAYNYLKNLGFSKYVFNKHEIEQLMLKFKIPNKDANYFN